MFSYNSRQDPGGTDAAAQKNAPPPNGEGRRSLLRAPREREVGRLAVAGCGPAAVPPGVESSFDGLVLLPAIQFGGAAGSPKKARAVRALNNEKARCAGLFQ